MGQEIEHSQFVPEDFRRFTERLRAETEILSRWLESDDVRFSGMSGGCELEAWLIDADLRPAPINEPFLAQLDNSLVVPELAKFNFEMNNPHAALTGDGLRRMQMGLERTLVACEEAAHALGARVGHIGILPTLREEDFTLENMSRLERYKALNDQVLHLRHGRPIELDIRGRHRLRTSQKGVMIESAATSFQIHIKVHPHQAMRYFNASKIVASAVVAAASNSPFLFGLDLWAETRIPLFEQAVPVGASDCTQRVSFGIRYARDSILECFTANLERYPVLLPRLTDSPAAKLDHLRFHNGTIWRWVRPLVAFDDDGTPHIRMEFRVVPAGPTIVDSVANAALYYGLVHRLAHADPAPESRLPFEVARKNFYAAARHGLAAELTWLDGESLPAPELLKSRLLPLAYEGLDRLGIDPTDRDRYLGVVEKRVSSTRTGTDWQREFVRRHGRDMKELLRAYMDCHDSHSPIHEWPL